MVPRAGLEPAQNYFRRILSPLRLPISPPRQFKEIIQRFLEATPRIELGMKVLQTLALPLGYVAICIIS